MEGLITIITGLIYFAVDIAGAESIYSMMDAMALLQRIKSLWIDSTIPWKDLVPSATGIKDQSDQKDMEKVVPATLGAAQQVESWGVPIHVLGDTSESA